jgi:hypothetical protein
VLFPTEEVGKEIVLAGALADTTIAVDASFDLSLSSLFKLDSGQKINFSVTERGGAVGITVLGGEALTITAKSVGSSTVSVKAWAVGVATVNASFVVSVFCANPIDPLSTASFFPVAEGTKWSYDYNWEYARKDLGYGVTATTEGLLTWQVVSVNASCHSLGFTIQEELTGTRTDWHDAAPDGSFPASEKTSPVERSRVLTGKFVADTLSISEYRTRTNKVDETLLWRYPPDTTDVIEFRGVLSAGFGGIEIISVRAERGVGISYLDWISNQRWASESESISLR